jgi:hypothetical protein
MDVERMVPSVKPGGNLELYRGKIERDTHPIDCTIVGVESLVPVWNMIVPHLKQLLENHTMGECSLADIYNGLVAKRSQLWVAINSKHQIIAWMITRVVNYPQLKRLVVDYLGGVDMDRWVHYTKFMEDFAAAHGCTEIEAWCRKGFTKKLKQHGFREQYSIMLKPVMRNLQ